jgi:hypothetical protein
MGPTVMPRRMVAVGLLAAALVGCGGEAPPSQSAPSPSASPSAEVDLHAEVQRLYEQTKAVLDATDDYATVAQTLEAFAASVDRLPVTTGESLDQQRVVAAGRAAAASAQAAADESGSAIDRTAMGLRAIGARRDLEAVIASLS